MSTHSVNVIEVTDVLPHANAERLEVIPVGGWQAVVKKGDFKPGDKAVYIEPDYTVPTSRPEFSFLAKEGRDRHRLKAVRLRGVLSYGLLIPIPPDIASASVGTNVIEQLDVQRWEPEAKTNPASDQLPQAEWPKTHAPIFDVESLQRFPDILQAGEPVIVTEKVHGANARYTFVNGTFYIGSRNHWLKDTTNAWARAAHAGAGIRTWCQANEGSVLYGEIYGNVQSLKYGLDRSTVAFAAFAATRGGQWVDQKELFCTLAALDVKTVPVLYEGPFDPEAIKVFAERDSQVAVVEGHMMEGIVIVPVSERFDINLGKRVAFKHISDRYWTGND